MISWPLSLCCTINTKIKGKQRKYTMIQQSVIVLCSSKPQNSAFKSLFSKIGWTKGTLNIMLQYNYIHIKRTHNSDVQQCLTNHWIWLSTLNVHGQIGHRGTNLCSVLCCDVQPSLQSSSSSSGLTSFYQSTWCKGLQWHHSVNLVKGTHSVPGNIKLLHIVIKIIPKIAKELTPSLFYCFQYYDWYSKKRIGYHLKKDQCCFKNANSNFCLGRNFLSCTLYDERLWVSCVALCFFFSVNFDFP